MPYKNDVFCIKKRMKQPFSFSLLFSLWLFKKQKNYQLPDTIDDYKIGAGEGNRTLVFLLRRQSHFGDVELAEGVHDIDHDLIIHVVRAFDDDAEVRIRGLQRRQLVF